MCFRNSYLKVSSREWSTSPCGCVLALKFRYDLALPLGFVGTCMLATFSGPSSGSISTMHDIDALILPQRGETPASLFAGGGL